MTGAGEFAGQTFTAPRARAAHLARVVLDHVAPEAPLRVLDLGCGTGGLVMDLLAALPHARLTGLDVSAASIELADAGRRRHPQGDRARFVAADYMAHAGGPWDLVVSDTVLHAIPASDDALFGKIAAELAPGGLLIYSMPADTAGNRALALLRRGLRRVRGELTDAALLALARAVHGGNWSDALLRERIPYMYLVPARWDSTGLHARLRARHGLELLRSEPVGRASPAQLVHRLAVLRRAPPA